MLCARGAYQTEVLFAGFLAIGLGLCSSARAAAQDSATHDTPATQASSSHERREEPWLAPLPVPADPELEQQIHEVQDALAAIDKEMVRRKEALNKTQDPATKATLHDEFDTLRKEREDLEALLHALADEAKLSEQTAIDEALARARWLERQQEYQQQREELIRDRQR